MASTTDTWYPLPANMETWPTAVLENLAQRSPAASQYIYGLEWSKLDPTTASGDGVIQLLNGMCCIPVKIQEGKLAPLDVIVSNYGSEPQFYPLTDTFLQKIYADNVIGKPVTKGAKEDEDYLGPSVKIKHIRTVDNLKYASKEAAENLLNMITKSASVSNWMVDNMPEVITALNERVNTEEPEKVASEEVDLPDLMVAWKDGNSFYANGNLVDAETVSDFCKMAGASEEELTRLMNGTPIVRDYREKVAYIHIPSEQEIVSMDIEDNTIFDIDGEKSRSEEQRFPDVCVTNAYFRDGTSKRGVLFTGRSIYQYEPKSTIKNLNPQDVDPSITPENFYETHQLELFICDEGYSLNFNTKTDARLALPQDTIIKISTPTDPVIGMVGIVLNKEARVEAFGRIEDITSAGSVKFYRMYDLIQHSMISLKARPDNFFYEVPDNRLVSVTAPERTSFVSNTGVNGILIKNNEGKFILDGATYSAVNCPFALMNKYAAAYDDALDIINVAKAVGKCEFEVLPGTTKTAGTEVTVRTDEEDTTKKKEKNNKNTKSGTDDEVQGQNQLAAITPEQALGITPQDLGIKEGAPGAGQAGANGTGNGVQAGYTEPVTTNDLENVVNVNDPKAMDAFMMSALSGDSSTSQENIMRTSDSIVDALEHLSKLLFLVRNGQCEFVSETDVQAAIKKLNDILATIGIQPTAVGQ